METKKRIIQFIDSKGISKANFYKKTAIKRGFLDTDKLESTVSDVFLAKIIEKYPELNLYWLIMGQGEMIVSNSASPSQKTAQDAALLLSGIPLIDRKLFTDLKKTETIKKLHQKIRYVIPELKEMKTDFMIKMIGTSMYPKYNNDDTLGCIVISTDSYIEWNRVYVIETPQRVIIKRLQKSKKDTHVLCVSDNKNYEAFEIPRSSIKSLALVIGVIHIE